MEMVTNGHTATFAFGENWGKNLAAGDAVLLFGELGAGKTVLAQGIAAAQGVTKDEYVRSPTFTIINQYRGVHPVFHIDLYRVDNLRELKALGLEDIFDSGGIAIIEWAEKLFTESAATELLRAVTGQIYRIEMKVDNEKTRHLAITLLQIDS